MDINFFSESLDKECFGDKEYDFIENGIRYTRGGIRKETVRICGFAEGFKRPATLVIPAEVRGKHVIFVDSRAFAGEPIEELVIENRNGWSLSILDSAFANCTKLHTVNLEEDQMIDFEKQAFMGCENLIRVEGENSTVRVYNNTFKDCISLENFQPAIVVLWKEAFNNCVKLQSIKFSESYALLHDGCFALSSINKIFAGNTTFDGTSLNQIKEMGIKISCSDETTVNKVKMAGVRCNEA